MQPLEPPMPPPPNITHPGIMAIDITDKFASAIEALSPGDIVKDEHFALFESVMALEIMDRKMDSGVLDEGESLDEEYDVTRHLLPEEILGIIDQLLCLEMAWHLGYPLSQTVLTSVYVEALMNPHPATIDEVDFMRTSSSHSKEPSLLFVLRAYCAGLLKACFLVNECMKEELYYEEEDFVTNTYERSLLSHIPVLDIKHLLQNAVTDLRAAKDGFSQQVYSALESRLQLRLRFLDAIDLSTIRHDASGTPKLPWLQMKRLIDDIENQHVLGKSVPEAFSTKLQRRLASTMPPRPMVKLSFEECIANFKRFVQNGDEVIDVLQYKDPQSLLNFILLFQAQKPQPLVFIRTILQNLLFKDMVVLGRLSIRHLLDHDVALSVLPCGPQLDPSFDDVEIPTDPRHQVASTMEVFRQRVADPYLELLRILCQNRCRVRRILCRQIPEWDILEADVAEVEDRLQAPLDEIAKMARQEEETSHLPLSSWVYLSRLRQMEWVVQLGFELRIYQPDELSGMYYFLKTLGSLRAQHIDRVKKTTALREQATRRHLRLREDDPLPSGIASEFRRSKQHLRTTMLDAACTWEFADGLSLLHLALLRLGLVKPPPRPYSTDALRYELRMRPFSGISFPQLPTHEEFREQAEVPHLSTAEVLNIAEAAVAAARKGFDAYAHLNEYEAFAINATAYARWVGNAKDCLRAAIAAGVAISTLKSAYERVVVGSGSGSGSLGDKDKEREKSPPAAAAGRWEETGYADLLKLKVEIPEPGHRYHDWWVVPKITHLK